MAKEFKDKNLVNEAVRFFMRTDRLHKKLCEKRLSEIALHRSQHVMLMHLSRFGRTVSQKELAESLHHKITVEELANETGIAEEEIQEAIKLSGNRIEYFE